MPVLPFHRYIGPGNDINSGPCVDDDDCIARKHDIKYENARTPRDVRLADVEAINEFRSNWLAGNWHSLIGDIGLSLKYCVETYTGVLYPKLGEYQPCEIVSIFHDFLKLHCVNKVRPFDRYRLSLFSQEQNDHGKMYDFTKRTLLSDEIYFYVLVAWYQLYRKNEHQYMNSIGAPLSKPKIMRPPQQNVLLVQNYDIFHLKAWIRFFAMFQASKMLPSDDYNEEEFSNLFMQYD